MVNFDCPNHYEDYVHRCGRTGRAGNKGWAYTFITEEEAKYAGDIVKGKFLRVVSQIIFYEFLWFLILNHFFSSGNE